MIEGLANSGAIPALEATVRFAGQRQRLIAHNIANLSTPNFQPQDVSVAGFQAQLDDAIQRRRAATGGTHGSLEIRDTREVIADAQGELRLSPGTPAPNILFHDRNNRDVERTMQDLAENAGMFRFAAEMLRSRHDLLRSAIAQRV